MSTDIYSMGIIVVTLSGIPILLAIYGLVAIGRTIYLYTRPRNSTLNLQTERDVKIYNGKSTLQTTNLVLSILMLFNFTLLGLAFLPSSPYFNTAAFTVISLLSLVILTPLFIGFNLPLIWKEPIRTIEITSYHNKVKRTIVNKVFLWGTWTVGYLVIAFIAFSAISNMYPA